MYVERVQTQVLEKLGIQKYTEQRRLGNGAAAKNTSLESLGIRVQILSTL